MRRVGDVLGSYNKQIGQIMMIRRRWSDIAGEVLSAHTEPVMIKNRALQVICDSPAWAQQVGMLTKTLESQIKAIAGIKVQRVEGKFGVVRRMPVRTKAARVFNKPDIDPDDVNKLKDEELAEAIRSLINT